MKFFKSSIFAALALAVSLTACDNGTDVKYAEAQATDGVYFDQATPSALTLSQNESSFAVTVERYGVTEAATYSLVTTYEKSIFTVPSTVAFAEGETTAELVIGYDFEAWGKYNDPQTIKIAFADGTPVNEFGLATLDLTVKVAEPWKVLGEGTYREAFICDAFDLSDVFPGGRATYPVQVEENEVNPGVYRVNGYGTETPWDGPDFFNGQLPPVYFTIDARDPENVSIPVTRLGFALGRDGYIGICSMSAILKDPTGTFGKLKDGVVTFPKGQLALFFYDESGAVTGGPYAVNTNGDFAVTLPGTVLADYDSSVEYAGILTDASGKQFFQGQVLLGEDVESAQFAAVPTSSVDEAVAAVTAGKVETIELTNNGQPVSFSVPCPGDGTYVLTAVCYAKGEAVASATEKVRVNLGSGNQYADFEDYGTAIFVDGWITAQWVFTDQQTGSKVTYEELGWEINVMRHRENKDVFLLVDPYTSDEEHCVLLQLGLNKNTSPASIIVDCSNPELVKIAPQYSGYTGEMGQSAEMDVYLMTYAGVLAASNPDATDEQIAQVIAQGNGNFKPFEVTSYEDGIIRLDRTWFGNDKGQMSTWNNPDGVVYAEIDIIPNGEQAAPRLAKHVAPRGKHAAKGYAKLMTPRMIYFKPGQQAINAPYEL